MILNIFFDIIKVEEKNISLTKHVFESRTTMTITAHPDMKPQILSRSSKLI